MPKEKVRYDNTYKAREMYAVLIGKERESRSYTKKEMQRDLVNEDLCGEFLKTCFEFDDSSSLVHFRKGLYLVIKQMGMSRVASETGIPRTTLYRMLWKEGNPNLKYLIQILKFLKLRLWVVSEESINTNRTIRYKNAGKANFISWR
ncbi:MAG: helix-turn-helix domain-containing protein [Bdellovibrionaceae bacterium]|nr:helix-turn-helix domain-containing protein [Pseudobdellovibrionaceae bacterium]